MAIMNSFLSLHQIAETFIQDHMSHFNADLPTAFCKQGRSFPMALQPELKETCPTACLRKLVPHTCMHLVNS